MMIREMKVVLILVAALLVGSIGAKAVGALQPPNPALRGFVEGCENIPEPCWYGIVPGETDFEAARRKFDDLKYAIITESATSVFYAAPDVGIHSCSVNLSNMGFPSGDPTPIVQGVTLMRCSALQSGDIMALWGKPERIIVGVTYGAGSIIATTTKNNAITWNESLFQPFSSISFLLPGLEVTRRTPWRGFAPKWRYCQLYPTLTACTF